jgi:hypothetical protein
MAMEDTRIVLRGGQNGSPDDLIVDHPQQPVDYIHPFPDGPVWTWRQEWRVGGGDHEDKESTFGRLHTHVRAYDLAS